MAVQVNPITQSLPATTAIQDPAVRRFAQAVDDALRALRSEEGAVESLKKAADAMNGAIAGGTPPSIAQWLFSSELYQKLTTEIARVDTQAKQDVLDEALARSQAIQEIQAALAEIESTPAYDPATTYQIGDIVTYDNKLYRAKAETTGNLPTNTAYWDKVGDYATLGDVVAAHTLQLSEIESDITDIGGDLAAEITARDTLAAQLRGTYTGTDVAMVSQGLLYSERQARVTADGVTVSNLNALRAQVGVTETGTLTEGFILNEQTIRNTNDLAIVTAVNTALAQITGVSTSISQSGENLIANWTTAQADKWSQIESEVLTSGGQTIRAALLQESQTRANLEGDVYASYTLRVDANGNIAGFGLAADENSSEFIVRADKFAVVTDIGGTPHVPFAIGPSGAEFTGLTSWGNVTGDGRPENNATVGANSANLKSGPGVNMVFNGDYTDGLAGTTVGWRSGGDQHTLGWNVSGYIVQGEGTAYIMQPGTSGAGVVFDANIWNGQQGQYFAVTPGERYEISAWLNCFRCEGRMSVLFLDAAGTQLQQSTGNAVTHASSINSIADMRQSWAIVTAPATAVKAFLIVRGYNTGLNNPYVFFSRVYFGEAGAGQTEPSLWTPGRGISQITTSNVTTYIDNAAIGNAQIGGDIWSSNYVYNSSGWYLQRNGSLYCANAFVRGDVEASSLKANTLMVNRANIVNAAVNTLQIEGNAVTIPVHSRPPLVYVTAGGWTSLTTAWINAEGSTVSIFASASVSTTTLVSAQNVSIRVLSPSGVQIGRNVISLRDGLYSPTFLITSSTEAGTYTLQIYKSGPASTLSVEDISLFLIGTKR